MRDSSLPDYRRGAQIMALSCGQLLSLARTVMEGVDGDILNAPPQPRRFSSSGERVHPLLIHHMGPMKNQAPSLPSIAAQLYPKPRAP